MDCDCRKDILCFFFHCFFGGWNGRLSLLIVALFVIQGNCLCFFLSLIIIQQNWAFGLHIERNNLKRILCEKMLKDKIFCCRIFKRNICCFCQEVADFSYPFCIINSCFVSFESWSVLFTEELDILIFFFIGCYLCRPCVDCYSSFIGNILIQNDDYISVDIMMGIDWQTLACLNL